jgi:hypothetical protein
MVQPHPFIQFDLVFFFFFFHSVGMSLLSQSLSKLNYSGNEEVQYFMKFVALLGKESLTIGLKRMSLTHVLLCIANLASFETMLCGLIRNKRIPSPQFSIISWFISFVVLADINLKEKYHGVYLLLMETITNKRIKEELKNVFHFEKFNKNDAKPLSLTELKNFEPFHDNDFLDNFRKISILPTVDEINCIDYPLTHIPNCRINTSSSFAEGIGGRQEEGEESEQILSVYDLLERHFRLLREDMLNPLKEELKKILLSTNPNDFTKQKLLYPIAYDIGTSSSSFVRIAFLPPSGLRQRLEKVGEKDSHLKSFFKEEASRLLSKDSLLLFVNMNTKKVSYLGRVIDRDLDEMVRIWKQYKKISVGVYFPENLLSSILLNVHQLESVTEPLIPSVAFSSFVIQSKISYFAYEPVLKCLKGICFWSFL